MEKITSVVLIAIGIVGLLITMPIIPLVLGLAIFFKNDLIKFFKK